MVWLALGVLLWSGAHLFPCLAPAARGRVAARLGAPYQGLFALVIVASLVLMVLGWRSATPQLLYAPPAGSRWLTNLLVFLGLVLFVASGVPTNLKRVVRHPQLTGFATWAAAHLLSNGDSRSLVLFGGLGVWALVAIVAINRRDGAWTKPEPQPRTQDVKPLVGAVVAFALLYLAHPWFAGVSPAP